MESDISYCRSFPEDTWGSTFHEISCLSASANIFACHTDISNLEKIATELSTIVLDQSWILGLDHRAKRAYETTAAETAKSLVKVFQTRLSPENKVASEFGS